MNSAEILQKLTTILVELIGCQPEEVTPETYLRPDDRPDKALATLGADSLDIVELVMAVEEEFGIDIPDDDSAKLLTVQDWITHLEVKRP